MSAEPRQFDLAVIGAGINGAGIARDAALRGLSVVVLEQGDLCSGTSAWSSRLIHGGLRYLEYGEIPLVYESLHERRILRHIAGHLVRPLRICVPVYEGARRGPLTVRLGMIAYDLLSWHKQLRNHKILSRDEIIAREPGLRRDGLRVAACYFDAQVTYAERLVLENLLAARAAGAKLCTYSRVTSIEHTDGRIFRLEYRDSLAGETTTVRTRAVVNAAGPWVDDVLGTTGLGNAALIGGTKGSHIVVGRFEGAPREAFYVEAASDGRPFFILPWNEQFLIGTTDIRYDGDPGEVRASAEEIEYLLGETNRVFPGAGLDVEHIHYAYAGIRPLPHRDKGPESAITRKHIIKTHDDIAVGLLSIIGGKLTTYRNLGEQAVDRIGKLLDRDVPSSRTRNTLLPGASGLEDAREMLAATDKLSDAGVDRLLRVYGGRAKRIAALVNDSANLAYCLDDRATVSAAEVAFVIAEEQAQTLCDIVFRRMMIGLDADQGRPLYGKIADLAAREFGWSDAEKQSQLEALHEYSDSFRVRPDT